MDIHKTARYWRRFWLRQAGPGPVRRWAWRLAAAGTGPYYARHALARACPHGFFDHRAQIYHALLETAEHVFIDRDVLIYQDQGGGPVRLGPGVHLHRGSIAQTGQGGSLTIGANTSIQARCHFAAYLGNITIGEGVQIAPNCAFFSYNHGTALGIPMRAQPVQSVGGIEIGDDAWLGTGSIVLDGARIGIGAVVAAGAVVTGDIPPGAVAAGVPARVRRYREAATTSRSGHGAEAGR